MQHRPAASLDLVLSVGQPGQEFADSLLRRRLTPQAQIACRLVSGPSPDRFTGVEVRAVARLIRRQPEAGPVRPDRGPSPHTMTGSGSYRTRRRPGHRPFGPAKAGPPTTWQPTCPQGVAASLPKLRMPGPSLALPPGRTSSTVSNVSQPRIDWPTPATRRLSRDPATEKGCRHIVAIGDDCA